MATATATATKIKLTRLKCGDQDNNIWYGYYTEEPEEAEKTLQMLTAAPNSMDEIEAIIFNDDITADGYRRILRVLTVYEEYGKRVGDTNATARKAQIYFFAALVNYNSTISKAVPGIKSFHAASEAASSARADGRELDYREYIVSGENDNWDNQYKSILTDNNDYSVKIQLKLPVKTLRFGVWKFATDRIPGVMELIGDPDNNKLMVPAAVWMKIVNEGISNRKSTKFLKFQDKSLSKVVKVDSKTVDDILKQNDYKTVIHFPNAYDIEINDNNELVLYNTRELPDIENQKGRFEWVEYSEGNWVLDGKEFYIVKKTGNTIHILQPR